MDIGTLGTTFALNTSLPNLPKLFGNLYRTVVAVLFAVWVIWPQDDGRRNKPLTALSKAVAWWDVVSTSWLTSLSTWIDERAQVLGATAAVVIALSLLGMYAVPLGRSASTLLLAVLLTVQTGSNVWVELVGPLIVTLVVLIARAVFDARLGDGDFIRGLKDKFGYTLVGAILALGAGLAPVTWFFNEDRTERRTGDNEYDPIHVRLAKVEGPSGAIGAGQLVA